MDVLFEKHLGEILRSGRRPAIFIVHCFTMTISRMASQRSQAAAGSATAASNQQANYNLNAIADAASRSYAVANTKKVYDRVEREWTSFCHWIKDNDPSANVSSDFPTHIDSEKIYKFMFYQCFRKKQQPGGINGGGPLTFDGREYEDVTRDYHDAFVKWKTAPTGNPIPDPEGGGVGISAIIQYRAGLKKLFEYQSNLNHNRNVWDQVWKLDAKNLVKIVEARRMRIKRDNYEEKVTKEFAGYHAVDRFDEIEAEFWVRGFTHMKTAFPYIRYRMLFLYTTSGILRCESLTKADLSDFQGVKLQKATDIDPLYVMVSQIPEGKFFSFFATAHYLPPATTVLRQMRQYYLT